MKWIFVNVYNSSKEGIISDQDRLLLAVTTNKQAARLLRVIKNEMKAIEQEKKK